MSDQQAAEWAAFPGKAPVCRDCGADWRPVQRGECAHCGSDAGPLAPTPTAASLAADLRATGDADAARRLADGLRGSS